MGRVTASSICGMICTLCAVGFSIAAFGLAVVLRLRLERLQANLIGDPEKEFMDDCLRDFEGLPVESQEYLDSRRDCLAQLVADASLNLLPKVRPTVDERICEPASLCTDGDPNQCNDEGSLGNDFYKPGTVRQCYDLIDQTKAARVQKEYFRLLDEVEARCTNSGGWSDYENKVHLRYCMWKHLSAGICTNSARTNCPTDGSCCPTSQRTPENTRPDRYSCRKSPTVGLYCQLVAGGNATGRLVATGTSLCNEATCPSFAWCLDLVDIPGLCLGPVCKDFRRTLDYAAAVAAAMGVALILDLGELGIRLCFPAMASLQWISVHLSGASIKLLGILLCLAGGVLDLLTSTVENSCFEGGDDPAKSAQTIAHGFLATVAATALGSFCLAPLTAARDTHSGLPYAKVVK